MNFRGSILPDFLNVQRCSVPLVDAEAECRKFRIVRSHEPITCDFRNDRCCGDRRFRFISSDDGTVRIVEPEPVSAVDEEVRPKPIVANPAPIYFAACNIIILKYYNLCSENFIDNYHSIF